MTAEEIEEAWNEIRQAVNAAYDLGAATKSDFPDMTPHYKALRHEMAVQTRMIENFLEDEFSEVLPECEIRNNMRERAEAELKART
jgi:hypothetical protein